MWGVNDGRQRAMNEVVSVRFSAHLVGVPANRGSEISIMLSRWELYLCADERVRLRGGVILIVTRL